MSPSLPDIIMSYTTWLDTSQRAGLYFFTITYLSLVHADLASDHYFADINNPLNQGFVKLAWGWTFSLVALYRCVARQGGLSLRDLRNCAMLVLGTAVWYGFARVLFPTIEDWSGTCQVSGLGDRRSCYKAGYRWNGFDISGHCFLLSWNNLFIMEETNAEVEGMIEGQQEVTEGSGKGDNRETDTMIGDGDTGSRECVSDGDTGARECVRAAKWVKLGLVVLVLLGELMMVNTALYFHTVPEKVLGTLSGLLPWYVVYRMPRLLREKYERLEI